MAVKAEIIERTVVYDRWSRISELLLRMPNGALEKRVVEDHGNAAAVLLYDPDRRVALLLRQSRAPVMEMMADDLLEVVAGRLDGKSGPETVRAEAMEEVGARIDAVEHVATLWTMPAVSSERLELFLATYREADRISEGGGAEDENECITVEEIALTRLRMMAGCGELSDAKTFILVQALLLRRPELFD